MRHENTVRIGLVGMVPLLLECGLWAYVLGHESVSSWGDSSGVRVFDSVQNWICFRYLRSYRFVSVQGDMRGPIGCERRRWCCLAALRVGGWWLCRCGASNHLLR